MTTLFTRSIVLLITLSRVGAAQRTPSMASLDSVILERSACYGTCPAYRLILLRSGAIRFLSRNRGDTDRTVRDSVAPEKIAALLPAALAFGFFRLPPTIAQSPELCPDRATDHPTVTVSLFGSGYLQHITDYHGCFLRSDHSTATRLDSLRDFEALVDSVAGSRRWVRPNRPR